MSSGFKKLAEVEAVIAQRKKTSASDALILQTNDGLNWEKFMLIRKFIVRKNERGLLFKDGDFQGFLEPGTYRFFDPLFKVKLQCYDLSKPEFEHVLLDFFVKHHPDAMVNYFTGIELNDHQVALVYKNGRLADILPPASRTFYWKGLVDVTTEIIDIYETFSIPHPKAALLVYTRDSVLLQRLDQFIYRCHVPEHFIGVLTVDGKQVGTLAAGMYAYWCFHRNIHVELWDTRLQDIEISGQEILSKDKVSLRINLAADYVIKDVLKMTASLAKPTDYLYKELQFGLRAAVGTRTLDELLENKHTINELVFTYLKERISQFGVEISNVGVKDIILPGEMKTILGTVVEAEKMAQANLIRRREETAATRSLLNTAKVMEDNPTALRLKELETLEKVTEKIGSISVYGGLEGLLKELVKIRS